MSLEEAEKQPLLGGKPLPLVEHPNNCLGIVKAQSVGGQASVSHTAIRGGIQGTRQLNEARSAFSLMYETFHPRSLFTVKPIKEFMEERDARPEGKRLAESLGLIDLLGYGVGCTVGAGIYSLVGIGAGIAGKAM